MPLEPIGQQFGDYQVLRLLGQGAQSCVYLGQHVRLQSRVAAVKLLRTCLSQEDIVGFQREADIIAKLQHPHIVNILDFNVKDGDVPFIVTEYYPSGTLRERHPHGEQVPPETIVTYVRQVAEALQYAHDHRVIHRDVKPANMLIGSRGDLVLSDFGIASFDHSTSSMCVQSLAGTAPYMAPEQIKQFPRRESDQYALAIVAYEWLVGELPFSGTLEGIAVKHLTARPPSLLGRLPHLPPRLEQVIFQALAKDPKERFPQVLDFALALENALQAEPPLPLFCPPPVQGGASEPPDTFEQNSAQEPSSEPAQEPGKTLLSAEGGEEGAETASEEQEPALGDHSKRKSLGSDLLVAAPSWIGKVMQGFLSSAKMNADPAVSSPPPWEPAAPSGVSGNGASTQTGPGARPAPAPLSEHISVSDRSRSLPPSSEECPSTISQSFPPMYQATEPLPMAFTARLRLAEERPQLLNGKEIMRKIGRENTPTSWRVLLPSQGKLALNSLWRGLNVALLSTINVYLLLWVLTVFLPSASPSFDSSFPIEQIRAILHLWGQKSTIVLFPIFLFGPLLISLVLGCLAALRYRIKHRQNLLVLLPEGLVYGKRGQSRKLQVINYYEVANLRSAGKQVFFWVFRKSGRAWRSRLDLSLFPAPRTLALTIMMSHDRYKREQGLNNPFS